MAGYSKRSLRDKLGLKEGASVALLGAPDSFVAEVNLKSKWDSRLLRETYDYIHVFTASREDLAAKFPSLKAHLATDGLLWISWPKKAAKVKTDLDENVIRDMGLAAGLVDVKVCAIDETWSGLKFVYRLKDR